jgi:hypothetical protein
MNFKAIVKSKRMAAKLPIIISSFLQFSNRFPHMFSRENLNKVT